MRKECADVLIHAVTDAVETKFATTAEGGHVAYQAIGDGPIDVLVTRMPLFPIDLMWDEPRLTS